MNYYNYDINLTDVPDEISLSFSIAGCPLHCSDCFWKDLQNVQPTPLYLDTYCELVDRYHGYISCVLFYGGEWNPEELIQMLCYAKNLGLKTCLYTGLMDVSLEIKQYLDYLKVGPYNAKRGNLSTKTTNQRMFNLINGEDITSKFWHLQ